VDKYIRTGKASLEELRGCTAD